jgi:hypothetical protein
MLLPLVFHGEVNPMLIRRVAQQLEETYMEMGQPTKIDDLKKRVGRLTEQG